MKKRISAFLFVFILCLSFGVTVFVREAGAENRARLVDRAGLLDESGQAGLSAELDDISERQQLDVVIVTVNTLDGKTPMQYADDFYDNNGYGFGDKKDGVLLLISMGDRDWWISTTGYGITAFTDAGLEYMSEQFLPALSDGDYEKAFTCYAALCDKFITQARTGNPYDTGNLPKEPFRVGFSVCIALAAGLVFALITTGVMKSKLKSVRFQPQASSYVKSGSMNITESRDLFLYRNVNRKAKTKNNSSQGGSRTHVSSSGTSHGGRGGKF